MTIRRTRAAGGLALVAAVLSNWAGCQPSTASSPTASEAPSPSVDPSITPAGTPGVGDPPIATLRVEGGDPVTGQLGAYSWAGGGSASPWLPGAPIAVASGERMTVTVLPVVVITDWTARLAPAADAAGAQAVVIGSGTGLPVLDVPGPGAWTLAVTVRFGEFGSATYAWRLDVP